MVDLNLESRVQRLCRQAINEGLASSAHDCSDGGLGVALAECCIPRGRGFKSGVMLPSRWDMTLFGEGQSRIVVSLPPDQWPRLQETAAAAEVPVLELGTTGGNRFQWGTQLDLPLSDIEDEWRHGLERF